ncbi:MAG: hypothetical protein OXB88_02780 [Bacteriovoracales bacterium]|nr:hypothetical protein [Bacteriovoracales bacterium]
MGIKKFSQVSGIPEKSIPKLETLDKYCAPFTKFAVENIFILIRGMSKNINKIKEVVIGE